MKSALLTCVLFAAPVSPYAAQKTAIEYQDGVLVNSRVENTGTSCSSSGTVNGQVDDNGNVTGTSHSSGNCVNTVTHFYTVKVGESTLVLRRTFTTGQKTLAMATLGWGALFMKQSVLADKRAGAQFKIAIENGTAHVKIGKRESIYRIVAESIPPTNSQLQTPVAGNGLQTAPLQVAPSNSLLDISSAPPGAEIEVDGAFVGSTPSSIEVQPGAHHLLISKKGFGPWERAVNVLPGHASISADLLPIEVANPQ